MSLVQRVMSIMLYGNAYPKRDRFIKNIKATVLFFRFTNAFMVCMSSSVTTSIIDKISEDHDAEVQS